MMGHSTCCPSHLVGRGLLEYYTDVACAAGLLLSIGCVQKTEWARFYQAETEAVFEGVDMEMLGFSIPHLLMIYHFGWAS